MSSLTATYVYLLHFVRILRHEQRAIVRLSQVHFDSWTNEWQWRAVECHSVVGYICFLFTFICFVDSIFFVWMNKIHRVFRAFENYRRMATYSSDGTQLTVKLSQGLIRGVAKNLPSRGSYLCFLGIPYAEPPIGDLRFEVDRPHFISRAIFKFRLAS